MAKLKKHKLVLITIIFALLTYVFVNKVDNPPPNIPSNIPNNSNGTLKEIYLAGGCFWGVQAYFDRMIGVEYSDVGYANGKTENTNYESISKTGHSEAVHIFYDPLQIKLEDILKYYFSVIDPTSLNKQGNDIGTQYRTAIYYIDIEDKVLIDQVIEEISKKYSDKIVTEVESLNNYILAEDYHQDYLEKNPNGYCHIDLTNIPNPKPK